MNNDDTGCRCRGLNFQLVMELWLQFGSSTEMRMITSLTFHLVCINDIIDKKCIFDILAKIKNNITIISHRAKVN